MAMRTEVVRIEDVFPLVDEYGNEFTSRDYTLKANQAYVAELAESMRAKGEPDEPIVLVQDGGIYRIKAGRSRYEAMKLLGTERFTALIDDDDTVKSVLETVVRTDVKKKYEDVERSRYIQQLALFGDDAYVSANTGIKPENVKRIRRAMKAVDDAAQDMTLERLLLIDEFADNEDAVRRLRDCREEDAQGVAARLRAERAMRERQAAFEAAFKLRGVGCTRERADVADMRYLTFVANPADAAESLPAEFSDGQVVALLSGNRCELYADRSLQRESAEQAAMRQQADAYRDAIAEMDKARDAWFWEGLATGRPMHNIRRECTLGFESNYWIKDVLSGMPKDAKVAAKNMGLSLFDFAIGYKVMRHDGTQLALPIAKGEMEPYRRGSANEYLDTLVMFQADGWEPGDGTVIIAKLSALLDGGEDGDE